MWIFKKYEADTDGNVAMMFAITTVMVLTGVGAAVDFSNMSRAKTALQAQVDAGVLAAALVDVSEDRNENQAYLTREDAANKVIAANGFDANGLIPELIVNDRSIVLSAQIDYKPAFGGILGFDTIRLKASAETSPA